MKAAWMMAAAILILASGCSVEKEGYVIKEYPFGSVGEKVPEAPKANNGATVEPPRVTEPSRPTTPTAPATPGTPSTTNRTTTPATQPRPVTTESLDLMNVNVVTVTGTKNVDLNVFGTSYLFREPRVDTDQSLCIVSVNGVDRIMNIDEEVSANGIAMKLKRAISARNVENNLCEFSIRSN